jgi:hypothetical protein
MLYALLSTPIHAKCFTHLIPVLIILMLSGERSSLSLPYRLLTFHNPNFTYIFCCPDSSKRPVQLQSPV